MFQKNGYGPHLTSTTTFFPLSATIWERGDTFISSDASFQFLDSNEII